MSVHQQGQLARQWTGLWQGGDELFTYITDDFQRLLIALNDRGCESVALLSCHSLAHPLLTSFVLFTSLT